MSTSPRISIGLPVYNGAATIASAIQPLLAQTFDDFELVISDNASTDSTSDVVQALAKNDARIKYFRQPKNVGANGNYSFVATAARGKYLKWASASDWCAPTFLERCYDAIERDDSAVLAAPRTRLFEDDLAKAQDYPDDVEILDETPLARLIHVVDSLRLNNAMNGLIRLAALRRTRLMEAYHGSDLAMMGHLALLGKFLLVREPLFYRRMEAATATALQDAAAVRRHHYPTMSIRALFQHWKHHIGWLRAVAAAPMPLDQRAKAMALVARRGYWQKHALAEDLQEAWQYLKHRSA